MGCHSINDQHILPIQLHQILFGNFTLVTIYFYTQLKSKYSHSNLHRDFSVFFLWIVNLVFQPFDWQFNFIQIYSNFVLNRFALLVCCPIVFEQTKRFLDRPSSSSSSSRNSASNPNGFLSTWIRSFYSKLQIELCLPTSIDRNRKRAEYR